MARYDRYHYDHRSRRDSAPPRWGPRGLADAMGRSPMWGGGYPYDSMGGGMIGVHPLLDPLGAYPYGFGAPFGWGYPRAMEPWRREPRRRPETSPAYGRGGDRELRRYLRGRGYDEGYAIEPRPPQGRRGGDRGHYDGGVRRR